MPQTTIPNSVSAAESGGVQNDARFVATMVIIEPKATKSVGLGAYNVSDSMPKFKLSCRPNIGGMLHVTLDRLDIPGTKRYIPMYQLRNLSEKRCRVTIKLQVRRKPGQAI